MKSFFEDIFEYTHHSNLQLIEIYIKNPEIYSEKIRLLASHTLNAHHIWNHRILGKNAKLDVWQPLELGELQPINSINFKQTMEILDQTTLENSISYTNSKGQLFTNTIVEMLFHIINHSSYHRGQLMTHLKNRGVEPISTDYIFYKR
ncbi:DinB family protein [Aequorivita sp. SDUM287046]|uniref:DinB family protein n=1 Tax=Aequorivita aurantiaca TaxID=3053356 RepID=A0ABT8DHV4_9FLAO|nr:DinB family protein [Aequorivita aurantiaca]MDN3724908.1 DinB family protein [Aequorivita aurantiaca]